MRGGSGRTGIRTKAVIGARIGVDAKWDCGAIVRRLAKKQWPFVRSAGRQHQIGGLWTLYGRLIPTRTR